MTGLQVNLGCGDRYVPGWWNVDLASMPYAKDEVVDLTGELPWPDGSVVKVYAGHVLEHLTIEDATNLCRRLGHKVMHGGSLMIVGPECDVAEQLLPPGGNDEFGATIESLVHGGHRWPGDEHKWRSTVGATQEILSQAGWNVYQTMTMPEVVQMGWPVADPRPRWQFGLLAVNL